MALKTVHEHPARRLERVSKRPLPATLRKALVSNLSEKHQVALLEWVEGVMRVSHDAGVYEGKHLTHDPDPFND